MPSSRRTLLVAAATASVALVLSVFSAPLFAKGAKPTPTPKPTPAPKPDTKAKDLVDTLADSKDPSAKTLLDALKAADLTTTLKGKGPFTLFAPTDDAFKKLPEGKLAEWMKPENKAALKAVLNDHVVSGKMLAADLAKQKTVKSAGGHTLNVKVGDDKAWAGIEDSKPVPSKTDIAASNGTIHFMDAVIVPSADASKAEPAMGDPAMK